VLDEAELKLPKAGVLNCYDPETGLDLYINTSDPVLRDIYETRTKSAQIKLAEELSKARVDHLLFTAKDEVTATLRDFFERRKRHARLR